MSTIAVDNVKPAAGGTSYSTRGIAKAWVNLNGTGVVAIRDSENVSSITDNGTGAYTVNFTNDFDVGDYAPVVACARNSTGSIDVRAVLVGITTTFAVGSVDVSCNTRNGTAEDSANYILTSMGDLA
jgi:hypothetical protein